MKIMPRLCLALSLCALQIANAASEIEYNTTETTTLGHALYIATEGDPLKAMAALLLAEENHALGKEDDLSRLYLADAFNAQGLAQEASQYYLQVGNNSTAKQRLRDTAWLHYAKLKHEQGEHEAAMKALLNIRKSLGDTQESEAAIIKAHALLAAGKVQEAVDTVPGNIKHDSLWALYQRYNLGNLLLGEHNNKYGAAVLHTLSEIDTEKHPELAAMKDQANLTLGYSLLKISKASKARSYLQQVRLNNLMSNMALLGMGWSYAIEDEYEKALVYWLELYSRPFSSTYSYESSLAIPYAFGQARAFNQSVNYYKTALNRFERDSAAMSAAKTALSSPKFVALISSAANSETGWINNWKPDNSAPESLFLPLFMDSPEFQLALKEYRTLLQLNSYAVTMSSEIMEHEKRSGASLPQLRQQHEQLIRNINQAIKAKQATLQQLASIILDRYQKQLTQYLQQARFGMAQVIEQATQKQGDE